MKPNPLSSLNHFTVPVAMLALLGWRAAHSEDALGQRHGALALHSPDPDGPAVPAEQYCLTSRNGCRADMGCPAAGAGRTGRGAPRPGPRRSARLRPAAAVAVARPRARLAVAARLLEDEDDERRGENG